MNRSLSEAYVLMFEFIDWWSGVASIFPEDVSNLYVSSIVEDADLANDRIGTVDPAAWDDWRHAVAMTFDGFIEAPVPIPCRSDGGDLNAGTTIDGDRAFLAVYLYFRNYWERGKFSEEGIYEFLLELWNAINGIRVGEQNLLHRKFMEIWQLGDLSNPTEAFNRFR